MKHIRIHFVWLLTSSFKGFAEIVALSIFAISHALTLHRFSIERVKGEKRCLGSMYS